MSQEELTIESVAEDARRRARRIRTDAAFQDGVVRDTLHMSADALDKAADDLEAITVTDRQE